MLAPRKTLWSTPLSVVDHLMEWIPLEESARICDIGCGDGRVLLEWAKRISTGRPESSIPKLTLMGIDIDQERINQCHQHLEQSRDEIHPNLSIEFVCENALNATSLWEGATIFFLYLIPRGLKLIHPMLQQLQKSNGKPLHVVSYMSKLPGESVTCRANLEVEHQPGASWPCYYYRLEGAPPVPCK
eukprot:Nitzschia sp. Nitz4//scaffold35_size145790//118964//119524//NITZ4_003051-RA/size145790-processed-gene-0.213-mRNA-1//1//CDS//3329549187//5127//frame0